MADGDVDLTDEGHGPEPTGVEPDEAWLDEEEVIRILSYAKEIGWRLGMVRYRWMFGEEPSEEDCHASISVSSKRYVGVIKVNANWIDYTSKNKAESIAHEVLHAFMSRLDEVWDQTIYNTFVPFAYAEPIRAVWQREMELVVDLLTMYMERVEELETLWDEIEIEGGLTPPGSG